VNGESMREVVLACKLAVEYRSAFHKDVVVDLIGYRRHGHNELDEPSFTSPLLYKGIRAKQTFPASYAATLLAAGDITPVQQKALVERLQVRHLNPHQSKSDLVLYSLGPAGSP
jgi:2-oxoglutarate dehydrogenase complex dehydrogenase (E1) component-like enzyme